MVDGLSKKSDPEILEKLPSWCCRLYELLDEVERAKGKAGDASVGSRVGNSQTIA